jgi:NAD(P)-dependent dehydrogenase (short-subunit alcohol dehydrogenase family)
MGFSGSLNMDLDGKTVLITGATNGLGRAVAARLSQPGVTLLLHGRDRKRGAEVVADAERAGARAAFYRADFAALREVRALGEQVASEHPGLHLLINNAGIGFGAPGSRRETSADGHELRFAVNYLAPVLLTQCLLPMLVAAAPSRIVNVASVGQQAIDFDDVMLARGYSGVRAYRQAKLALIMWTLDLAEVLRPTGVTVNAVHPATFMDTHMVHEAGVTPTSTVEEGARAVLNLAVGDAGAKMTGGYFDGLSPARPKVQAYDEGARERLRRLTQDLIAER